MLHMDKSLIQKQVIQSVIIENYGNIANKIHNVCMVVVIMEDSKNNNKVKICHIPTIIYQLLNSL